MAHPNINQEISFISPEEHEENITSMENIESFEDLYKTYKPTATIEPSVSTSTIRNEDGKNITIISPSSSTSVNYNDFRQRLNVRYSHFRIASGQMSSKRNKDDVCWCDPGNNSECSSQSCVTFAESSGGENSICPESGYSFNDQNATYSSCCCKCYAKPPETQTTESMCYCTEPNGAFVDSASECESDHSANSALSQGHNSDSGYRNRRTYDCNAGMDQRCMSHGQPTDQQSINCCCPGADSSTSSACSMSMGRPGGYPQVSMCGAAYGSSPGCGTANTATCGSSGGNMSYGGCMPCGMVCPPMSYGGGMAGMDWKGGSAASGGMGCCPDAMPTNCLDIESFLRKFPQASSCLPSCMTMPSPTCMGNGGMVSNDGGNCCQAGGNLVNDTLQSQTVYTTDYKPFNGIGNNFNHFPNSNSGAGMCCDSGCSNMAMDLNSCGGCCPGSYSAPPSYGGLCDDMCCRQSGGVYSLGNICCPDTSQCTPLSYMNMGNGFCGPCCNGLPELPIGACVPLSALNNMGGVCTGNVPNGGCNAG